jgi:hypothetical protein
MRDGWVFSTLEVVSVGCTDCVVLSVRLFIIVSCSFIIHRIGSEGKHYILNLEKNDESRSLGLYPVSIPVCRLQPYNHLSTILKLLKGSSILVCDRRFILDIYSRLEDNGLKRGRLGSRGGRQSVLTSLCVYWHSGWYWLDCP